MRRIAIRKALLIIAGIASAAAHAACEFPYYPEYADFFSQYDEVTPLLAKKVVMVVPVPFAPRGAIVCEPLRIRDIAGKPLGYTVPTYSGENVDVVRRWEKLADRINNGQRIPAAAVEADLDFIRDNREKNDFTSAGLLPYSFQGLSMPTGSSGFTSVFSGYRAARERAQAELDSEELYFKRIVGGGLSNAQAFEFGEESGETIIIGYDPCAGVSIVDPEREKESMREVVRSEAHTIIYLRLSGRVFRNIKRWEEVDEAIPDDVAADDFAVIIDYEFPKEEGPSPEHEEFFNRFRPLTREEVLMLVSAKGKPPGDGWAGSPILEPICFKTLEGEICYYWLMSYEGDDASLRAAAERLIAMLNADGGFDPYEFLELREILYAHSREFNNFFVYGWTWNCGIGGWGESIPGFLYDFDRFFEASESLFGKNYVVKAKLLAPGIDPWGRVYAFGLLNIEKWRYVYTYPDGSDGGGCMGEIDENGIREVAEARIDRLLDHYKRTPEHYDEIEAKWADTFEYVKKHAVKEGGYYRLQHLSEEE